MESDLEELLRSYLSSRPEENGWRRDMKKAVSNIADQVMALDRKVDARFSEHDKLLLLQGHRLEKLEDADEVTGVNHQAAVLEKLKTAREESQWLKRWLLGIAATLVVAVLVGSVGLFVKFALR